MKKLLLLLIMLLTVEVNAGTIGSGDCSTFPGTKDAQGTDLTSNDYATVNYANDVKHTLDNIQQFLISTPSFMGANIGIGFIAPKDKLQINGNISIIGIIFSTGTGNNYFGGTITSDKFIKSTATISTGQLHSRITTGTAPLTVNSTTKVTNLNADIIDDKHILSGCAQSDSTGYQQISFGGVFSSTVSFVCSISQNDTNHTVCATVDTTSATITTWNNSNARTGPIGFNWIAVGN